MNDTLQASLNSIEASLERLVRPTTSLLQPGATREDVRVVLAGRRLDAPDDLLGLWGWRNGTAARDGSTLGDMWLVPGFYLLSVQEAIARFDGQVADSRWDRSWLPVFADGGGDFLTVQCGAGDGMGSVRRFRNDDFEVPIEYRRVERMAATFAAAYERGLFYVDGDGWLEQDDAGFALLAAELNPDVPSWRDALT